MKTAQVLRQLLALLFLAALSQDANGFGFEPSSWPQGSQVIVKLGFGPTPIQLQDGLASWDASAADALDIWNGYLDFISATSTSTATVPQASGDGINSAFFSSTVFGDAFEQGTLAITVVFTQDNIPGYTAEADVVVNTAFRFDSYRGPLQTTAADFHRIMVHEFGHVLGLDHVTNDPPGQAIMEPIISDLDHPAFDDTYGIRQLYGAFVYYWDFPVRLRTGDSFESSLDVSANNAPTSYTITGLPPGITYDPATGLISGIATTSGRYGAVLVAHGPYADAYSAKSFNVQGFDRVQGLLGIIKINGSAMVADPARPRIYASGPDEINAIDTQSFDVTEIGSGSGGSIPFLSVSADSSLLLVTNPTDQPPMLNRIDLDSLSSLAPLPVPANKSAVLEGLENRDFVSDSTSVFQFDRATGETQTFIAMDGAVQAPEIALSTDRGTLFATELLAGGDGFLLSYDVTGAEPVLLKSIPGEFLHLTPSPDGKYLYYTLRESIGGEQPLQAPLPDLVPAVPFAQTGYPGYERSLTVGPDGTIYRAGALLGPSFATYSLYDPVSLQETFNIDLNHFDLDPPVASSPPRLFSTPVENISLLQPREWNPKSGPFRPISVHSRCRWPTRS